MPDYSKCFIYKLCCRDANITNIYVGSTCNVVRRKASHKHACNNDNDRKYNMYIYQFIRNNGGFENWTLVVLKEFCCENKSGKELEERKWIEDLKPKLNQRLPTRTKKEYYEDNIEKVKETNKQYYIDNIEKVKETKKQYYISNKEKVKETNKQYRIDNVEKIKEKRRENKEMTI